MCRKLFATLNTNERPEDIANMLTTIEDEGLYKLVGEYMLDCIGCLATEKFLKEHLGDTQYKNLVNKLKSYY